MFGTSLPRMPRFPTALVLSSLLLAPLFAPVVAGLPAGAALPRASADGAGTPHFAECDFLATVCAGAAAGAASGCAHATGTIDIWSGGEGTDFEVNICGSLGAAAATALLRAVPTAAANGFAKACAPSTGMPCDLDSHACQNLRLLNVIGCDWSAGLGDGNKTCITSQADVEATSTVGYAAAGAAAQTSACARHLPSIAADAADAALRGEAIAVKIGSAPPAIGETHIVPIASLSPELRAAFVGALKRQMLEDYDRASAHWGSLGGDLGPALREHLRDAFERAIDASEGTVRVTRLS